MSDPQIKFQFDCNIDEDVITKVKEEAKSKNRIKFPKDAVPVTAVDWDTSIVIDKSKHGLRAVPLSINSMQILIGISSSEIIKEYLPKKTFKYDSGNNNFIESILSYQNLMKFGLDAKSLITSFFNKNGLNIVLTQAAYSYLKRKKREHKKLMTPFKFYVPEEVSVEEDLEKSETNLKNVPKNADLLLNTGENFNAECDEVAVQGPFVEDVYSDEIQRYRNKISEFGFDDSSKDVSLHPFQVDDVAILACKKQAFISHEPGLGKTLISIALCHMHGHKRVLIVCPGPAIGSFKSGWRHELSRFGVPKENIHLMKNAEDLPFDFKNKKKYPDNGRPHFFLTDYGSMSKDKIEWSEHECVHCSTTVKSSDRGRCKNFKNTYHYYPPSICPSCKVDDFWNNKTCRKDIGGCGFRLWKRVVPKGMEKKGCTNAKPMWKRIKRGMFQIGLFDESQTAKNISSKRGHAIQHIPGLKRTYIITGTMMTSYVKDLFWQLNILFKGFFPLDGELIDFTAPNIKHGSKVFLDMFNKVINKIDKSRAETTLINKDKLWSLLSTVQVRRRSSDPEVNQQINLPKINFSTEYIEMDDSHKMVYSTKTGEFQREINGILQSKGNFGIHNLGFMEVEKQINILRIASCTPEIDPAYSNDMTNKDARILELIAKEKDDGGKTVIFSSFKAFTEKMEELCTSKGYNPMVIDGTVPISKRWPMIDNWRSKKDNDVIIAGIKSMNYAVNLTSISDKFKVTQVIFATPEWIPTVMEQAWKRVHRIGQTKEVNVKFIYLEDTVEERMAKALYKKRQDILSVIDRSKNTEEDSVSRRSAVEIAEMILASSEEAKDSKKEAE